MNLVDSSGWREYLAPGPNASAFEKPLTDVENLVVSMLCLYEVFEVVLRERGESDALRAGALMQQGKVIEPTAEIALMAARTSLELKLPTADSIILGSGYLPGATV